MTNFADWWHRQADHVDARSVAEAAWRAGASAERHRVAQLLRATPQQLLLMAGDMTAQELRTVSAVLDGFARKVILEGAAPGRASRTTGAGIPGVDSD